MSPRTGRPRSDNPKNIQIKILADKDLAKDLDFCCERLNKSKSDIIRMGIQKVKESVSE